MPRLPVDHVGRCSNIYGETYKEKLPERNIKREAFTKNIQEHSDRYVKGNVEGMAFKQRHLWRDSEGETLGGESERYSQGERKRERDIKRYIQGIPLGANIQGETTRENISMKNIQGDKIWEKHSETSGMKSQSEPILDILYNYCSNKRI